jgi:hypothetical protein
MHLCYSSFLDRSRVFIAVLISSLAPGIQEYSKVRSSFIVWWNNVQRKVQSFYSYMRGYEEIVNTQVATEVVGSSEMIPVA